MPVGLPWWQAVTFGTMAWRISMARRQVVESANSALKGAFADLSRGFFRVMGLSKLRRTTEGANGFRTGVRIRAELIPENFHEYGAPTSGTPQVGASPGRSGLLSLPA
jgi:hypothetical protein